MEVCQKNGQSLGEADECGKSLTHFEVCQSVSEVPSPAVYGPSSAFSFLVARSTFQSESGTQCSPCLSGSRGGCSTCSTFRTKQRNMSARKFFSDVFRSYMSGNKPLTCGDGISGIALIELTLYNTSCIDKWLSTRPVFDAGLLPGIGAERSVK